MKVLVACEFSEVVKEQFLLRGHDAHSCDFLPGEKGLPNHHQCDVREILNDGWDLMIAHPPCTHLSKAGGWCWKYKIKEQEQAFEFVKTLWEAPIERICIENPVGWLNTNWQKPDQIIHPYYFSDPYLKETCLWLKGLQKLTYVLRDDMFYKSTATEPKANWVKPGNIRNRRFNRVPEGGKGNSHDRSRFFTGIAVAMAEQWGSLPVVSSPVGTKKE